MANFTKQIHHLLIKKGKTIAVAESCTGGRLSSLLTKNPGSSGYFILGVIAYSNKAKEKILHLPGRLILKQGAVSAEVAQKMAAAIRKIAHSDFGISITGIAGPTGATQYKPKGTVFIAVNSQDKKICQRFWFEGSRAIVQKTAALKALELLKVVLL